MTFAELAELIAAMTDEQQQMDVTVLVSGVGEYYPLVGDYPVLQAGYDHDVLPKGQNYLVI